MRTTWLAVMLIVLTAGAAHGAPISDGSIYQENFEGPPHHPLTNAIGVGATISGGAGHIGTTTDTEGVIRVNPTSYPSEYVVEYDWTLNGPSGDNFYMFYAQGPAAPWNSAVGLRTIPVDDATWAFQVDYFNGGWAVFDSMNYGQTYHVTLHVKDELGKPVDIYIDGALIGEFASQNPSLTTDLVQWGDPSGGAGFGSATIDNISIGAPVPEPSTVVFAASVLWGGAVLGQRRLKK